MQFGFLDVILLHSGHQHVLAKTFCSPPQEYKYN
jgi:hypothetical protein